MARAGRKRKADRSRYKSGRLVRTADEVGPTVERRAMRAKAAPDQEHLASCVIDIMLARRIISRDQRAACVWLARLHQHRYGGTPGGGIAMAMPRGGEISPEKDEALNLQYHYACRGIDAETRGHIIDVAAYDRVPRWIVKPSVAGRLAFLAGATMLVQNLREFQERAAASRGLTTRTPAAQPSAL